MAASKIISIWMTYKSIRSDKLFNNDNQDRCYCPKGQKMNRIGQSKKRSENNYFREITSYCATNFQGCPIKGVSYNNPSEIII